MNTTPAQVLLTKEQGDEYHKLIRDRERLLNVLEHCALPDSLRPKNQHEVAAMVVKEYRIAMSEEATPDSTGKVLLAKEDKS